MSVNRSECTVCISNSFYEVCIFIVVIINSEGKKAKNTIFKFDSSMQRPHNNGNLLSCARISFYDTEKIDGYGN